MRIALLSIFLSLLIYSLKAKSQIDTNQIAKNAIYIEAAGIGGYGSINYERLIFDKGSLSFNARVGFSTYHLNDFTTKFNPDIIIPISISGFFGNNHKVEFGIGQAISNIVYLSNKSWQAERETNIHANFIIGYRYQKEKGGFVFRCNYSPLIEFYKYYRHWFGVSFGYAF